MKYPGRVIQKNEKDKNIVKAIQRRLNELGCGPLDVDGGFGPKTFSAVKLFQARHSDANGQALVVDGKIGPVSWQAMFGTAPITVEAGSDLLKEVLKVAKSQVGVREAGTNRGPDVDKYLSSVGLKPPPGNPWCMAFVYWCFEKASQTMGRGNPAVKSGHCLTVWNNATGKKVSGSEAVNNPAKIKPGYVFIMDYGGGKGHTGFVVSVNGGIVTTIEGNTNDGGSREGDGVYQRSRKINSIKKGFIEFK